MTPSNPLAALAALNGPDSDISLNRVLGLNPTAAPIPAPAPIITQPSDEDVQRKKLEELRDKLQKQQDEPSFADTVLQGLLKNGLQPEHLTRGQVARNALANFARGALMKENFTPIEQEQQKQRLQNFTAQLSAARAQAAEDKARRMEGMQMLTGLQRDLYANALAKHRADQLQATIDKNQADEKNKADVLALKQRLFDEIQKPAAGEKSNLTDEQIKLTKAKTELQQFMNKNPFLLTKRPDQVLELLANDPEAVKQYENLYGQLKTLDRNSKFAPQPKEGPVNYTAPLPGGEGNLLDKLTNRTMAGRSYIDATGYTGKEYANLVNQAAAAGVPVVSKDTATGLQDIDTTKQNLKYMLDVIESKLPKDAQGRIIGGTHNTIDKVLQNDPQLAAVGTFRSAAIQAMRSVAGSKGLRINQAEIKQAQENDIPKITDTVATAQAKLANMYNFLESVEKSSLIKDRSSIPSANVPGVPPKATPAPTTKSAKPTTAVPTVGGTFNGAKVKSVTRID